MQAETSSVPSSSATSEQLVRRILLASGRRYLTAEERRSVLSLGPQAVPPLISLLADASMQSEDSAGDGCARERAATLLADLGAVEAIEPMLEVLRTTDGLTATHEAVREAIPLLGKAVLEPVLAAYAGSMEPALRFSLASALSRLGHRDPRILSALVEHLHENRITVLGAWLTTAMRRRCPRCMRPCPRNAWIRLHRCSPTRRSSNWAPRSKISAAHLHLPRRRSGRRSTRCASAIGPRSSGCLRCRLLRLAATIPCPCGSGKKYKKCCGA
jgi:hypothetical protein